jgi:hypothetical protein
MLGTDEGSLFSLEPLLMLLSPLRKSCPALQENFALPQITAGPHPSLCSHPMEIVNSAPDQGPYFLLFLKQQSNVSLRSLGEMLQLVVK